MTTQKLTMKKIWTLTGLCFSVCYSYAQADNLSIAANDGIYVITNSAGWTKCGLLKADTVSLQNGLIITRKKKPLKKIPLKAKTIVYDTGKRCIKAPCPGVFVNKAIYRCGNNYLLSGGTNLYISKKAFKAISDSTIVNQSDWEQIGVRVNGQ
jgi:hypothetical protein